jgi:succinyl-CoA synthetase beta subunit
MKIHEYQAKELLAAAGALIPQGTVAASVADALKAFDGYGGVPVVLKAQVHAGGRGKGLFKGFSYPGITDSTKRWGGVKYITNRDKVAEVAEVMFKYPLVTKQTGEKGQPVSKILVQVAADIARELYLGLVLDRAIGLPVMMASTEGGVDIEEVAAHSPDKILKRSVDPDRGLMPFQSSRLAYELGFTPEQAPKAEVIMKALAKVFLDKDCSLAEINPLVVTTAGEVMALDAKMAFDDNALFRHPELEAMRDLTEEDPAELRATKANLNFISLAGNIGCLVNGAGLAMSTMDIIKLHGGDPANFLDVGGGVTAEGAIEAFRIILSDPKVKGILVNVFGGIAKCDVIAEALIKAGREVGFKVPVVVRLEGTNADQARQMLKAASSELPMMQTAAGLTEAAKMVVAAAK